MEYVRVEEKLPHAIGDVWAIVAAFGGIALWIDGVESCSIEGNGVGAIRAVVRGGSLTRERLEMMDAEAHMLSYALLPPYRLPARDVRATISLEEISPRSTRMLWYSEASAFEAPMDEIATYIQQFYRASIRNLDRLIASSA